MHCGTSGLFWKDLWLNDMLSVSHPMAYSFSSLEDIYVKDFLWIMAVGEAFHLQLSIHAHAEVS